MRRIKLNNIVFNLMIGNYILKEENYRIFNSNKDLILKVNNYTEWSYYYRDYFNKAVHYVYNKRGEIRQIRDLFDDETIIYKGDYVITYGHLTARFRIPLFEYIMGKIVFLIYGEGKKKCSERLIWKALRRNQYYVPEIKKYDKNENLISHQTTWGEIIKY